MNRLFRSVFLVFLISPVAGFPENLKPDYHHLINQQIARADSFHLIDGDSSLIYAGRALALAEKIHDRQLEALAKLRLGYALTFKGHLDSATIVLRHVCNSFQVMKDKPNEARTLNALGLVNFHNGDYRKSMEHFLGALHIFEQCEDQDGLGAVYVNLSGIYEILGEYELDLNYSKRAAKVYKSLGDMKQYAICLNNIAHTYNNIGQHTMAIKYLKKSIDIKEDIGATSSLAYSYTTLYESYRFKNDRESGKKFLDLSFDIFTKEGNIEGLIESNGLLAGYYALEKNFEIAIDHGLVAYMLARQNGHRKAQMDLCSDLSTYYLASGAEGKAIDFQKRYLILKDSLLSVTIGADVMNAQVSYELNKRRQSLKQDLRDDSTPATHLSQSNELVNYISVVVIVLLAAVQIIAIFYYWTQRKRPRLDET